MVGKTIVKKKRLDRSEIWEFWRMPAGFEELAETEKKKG
jgi:hypothetical protein